MASANWRENIRGVERETLDLLSEVITSAQWVRLLRGPLVRAVDHGNRGLTQKLLGAGAEIGDALHIAVRGGHGDIVNDLLDNGASLDGRGTGATAESRDARDQSPLEVAAEQGNAAMVELLLLRGADKDELDDEGFAPLFWAIAGGHVATVVALLSAGANANVLCGPCGDSALGEANIRGKVDILRILIEHGANVNFTHSCKQLSVLHQAAYSNSVGAINVLVEAGANIEARDDEGLSPLHHAAKCVSTEAAVAILKHGADANARTKPGRTPLRYAAAIAGEQGAGTIVDLLLRSGADETIPDEDGKTAMDVIGKASGYGYYPSREIEPVRLLLANAPTDRARRLRRYLVLCRAHPDRMRRAHEISSSARVGVARRTRSATKQSRSEGDRGDGATAGRAVEERPGVEWADAVARVIGLQEEGIFRTIVGYL